MPSYIVTISHILAETYDIHVVADCEDTAAAAAEAVIATGAYVHLTQPTTDPRIEEWRPFAIRKA